MLAHRFIVSSSRGIVYYENFSSCMCAVLRDSIYSICMFNIVLIPPAQTRARHLRMSSSLCKYLYICIWLARIVYSCGALYRACALSLHVYHAHRIAWKPHRIYTLAIREQVKRWSAWRVYLRCCGLCARTERLHTYVEMLSMRIEEKHPDKFYDLWQAHGNK